MAQPAAPPMVVGQFLTIEPKRMSSEQDIVDPLKKYIKLQGEFDDKDFEVSAHSYFSHLSACVVVEPLLLSVVFASFVICCSGSPRPRTPSNDDDLVFILGSNSGVGPTEEGTSPLDCGEQRDRFDEDLFCLLRSSLDREKVAVFGTEGII